MPSYTDAIGNAYILCNWLGNSYKATVINRAYANSQFWVLPVMGSPTVFFKCFWCKKLITSGAVEGDHIVQQALGKSGNEEHKGLFQDAEATHMRDGNGIVHLVEAHWNLVLSCSECNGGSRNKAKLMVSSDYTKDRDRQGPQGGGGGGSSSSSSSSAIPT